MEDFFEREREWNEWLRRGVWKRKGRDKEKSINCIWNNVKDKKRMDHKNYFDEETKKKRKWLKRRKQKVKGAGKKRVAKRR